MSNSADKLLSLFTNTSVFIDANDIIDDSVRNCLVKNGKKVLGVGKGHWNEKGKGD